MIEVLKFNTVVGRQVWWFSSLGLGVLMATIQGFLDAMNYVEPTLYSAPFALFLVLFSFFLVYSKVALSVARLKDSGNNPWWVIVPVIGFILCGFSKTVNNNKIEDNK